ncbi:MAG: hypothetical protein AAF919_16900 [Pseudomonadota bacterium]
MNKGSGSAAAETFSVQLTRQSPRSPVIVRHAEIVRRNYRHRLAFATKNTVGEVFVPDLAKEMLALAQETMGTGPRVDARPDFVLSAGGLVLGGLRAIVSGENTDGSQQITVRFRYFVGGIQNAFAANTYFDRPTLEHREQIGVRALEDVAMPLLDMAQAMRGIPGREIEDRHNTPLERRLAAIEAQAADLEFYAGLLRRYVDECGPDRIDRLSHFADSVGRLVEMAEPPAPNYLPPRAASR